MELLKQFLITYELPIKIIVIMLTTIFIARLLNHFYKRFIEKSAQKSDDNLTTFKFLDHLITATIYIAGFSYALSLIEFLKPVAQSIIAGAGILAIAVGFAAQQSLGNIISGVFIVISKPYRINDRITIDESQGFRGVVEDISLRHTVIRNFENQRIIIPNSIISNQVLVNSNFEDLKICRLIDIGISYESDIDLAKKIIKEEIESHPNNIDNRNSRDIAKGLSKVTVRVTAMLDSSITLRAWAWAEDAGKAFELQCDTLESIKKRFDKEGIVIPFPQRTISYLEPQSHKKSEIKEKND